MLACTVWAAAEELEKAQLVGLCKCVPLESVLCLICSCMHFITETRAPIHTHTHTHVNIHTFVGSQEDAAGWLGARVLQPWEALCSSFWGVFWGLLYAWARPLRCE